MSRVVLGDNKITQKYSSSHKGVDIGFRGGNNDYILAHSDGIIINAISGKKNNLKAKGNETYGNYIKIKHYNGYYTLYAHLNEVFVKPGEKVIENTDIWK